MSEAYSECPRCEGQGILRNQTECPRCEGSGTEANALDYLQQQLESDWERLERLDRES